MNAKFWSQVFDFAQQLMFIMIYFYEPAKDELSI